MELCPDMRLFVLEVVLQLGKWILFDLPLRFLVAYSALISAVLGLEDPLRA